MNRLYQRTFDHVHMPEDRARSLRAVLASRCSEPETEVIMMNKRKFLRRPAAFLIAILLIGALSITALACDGGRVIHQIGDVIYQIVAGDADLPADGVTYDLTDQEPDAVLDSSEYTEYIEEDGTVRIILNDGDGANID